MLAGRRVVLGVSGGIACYKACTIARRLTEAGAAVDVVLTAAATEFVRPAVFEGLTGRPASSSLWERGRALAHIDLGREADLIVVAPATAHLLARAAQGLADDLLTTLLLAAEAPILAAPAMNDTMYAHEATRANLQTLRDRGWTLVGPAVGALAEGPSDRPGRMAEPEEILAHAVRQVRSRTSRLRGRRVLVTAGPTREYLDPVRVITNASSGRMGYAIAEAAFARGAEVVLVSGPTALTPGVGVRCERVTSTEELAAAVRRHLPDADVLVMAAAPADFRPREPAAEKRAREAGRLEVALEPTPDVLAGTVADRRDGMMVVGFALESRDGVERARRKLQDKHLDLVVLNSLDDPDSGFETDTNRVTLISPTVTEELDLLPKREVAERILDRVERAL